MTASAQLVFITGTDTGVGKTVLTSLLLAHLRQRGARALAVKPFCSGGRADGQLLHALQDGGLSLDEINPFHFEEPLAPLVAARLLGRKIPLPLALASIQQALRKLKPPGRSPHNNPLIQKSTNPFLLVEGAGGLLSPLGEQFDLLALIQKMMRMKKAAKGNVSVIVVAANRLGTINHTRLTVRRLQEAGIKKIAVVLNNVSPPAQATPDMKTNFEVLAELLHPLPVFSFPHLKGSLDGVNRLQSLSRGHRLLLSNIVKGKR